MNIDELQAGRELDALVAEKVMGWVRLSFDCAQGAPGSTRESWQWKLVPPNSRDLQSSFRHIATDSEPPMRGWDNNVPHYSTDIAAAWQAVEKCNLLVSPTLQLPGGRQWIAGEFKGVHGVTNGGARYCFENTVSQAATAPLAICRAALKVVQNEC